MFLSNGDCILDNDNNNDTETSVFNAEVKLRLQYIEQNIETIASAIVIFKSDIAKFDKALALLKQAMESADDSKIADALSDLNKDVESTSRKISEYDSAIKDMSTILDYGPMLGRIMTDINIEALLEVIKERTNKQRLSPTYISGAFMVVTAVMAAAVALYIHFNT